MRSPLARLARRRRARAGRLRWAIRISAPPDPSGDVWGDVAFADDLVAALRRLGQDARVDRRGAVDGPPVDVVLVLRGLFRIDPTPGALSYLWVISHPELVGTDELGAGWSGVYAASTVWPGRESPVAVEPLLQATAADRFSPGPSRPGLRHDILFVGTSRRVHRPIVMAAASLDVDLSVYGHDWEPYLDPSRIRAQLLESRDLPDAYRGARRVLNDHWEDMRREGFLSNRLFDAVACGTRVVSDGVAGIHEVFGNAVRVAGDDGPLADLLAEDAGWPGAADMRAVAERIRVHHSFDTRAHRLVARALEDHRALARSPGRVILDGLRRLIGR